MIARRKLFHPRVVRALIDFSDPRKTVRRPLVKGQAAGKMDLIYQLYPPREVHRNSIPAEYAFVLEDWVTHKIALMVSMVDTADQGEGLVFGFIAHDHWQKISRGYELEVDGQHHFVVVKYNPVIREGDIYLYKEAYAVIEALYKKDLDRVREEKRREAMRAQRKL